MILPKEVTEKLQQLPKSLYGSALILMLEQTREELNDVKTIESWEEALGRKFALKFIDDLFSFMGEKKVEPRSKNIYT